MCGRAAQATRKSGIVGWYAAEAKTGTTGGVRSAIGAKVCGQGRTAFGICRPASRRPSSRAAPHGAPTPSAIEGATVRPTSARGLNSTGRSAVGRSVTTEVAASQTASTLACAITTASRKREQT